MAVLRFLLTTVVLLSYDQLGNGVFARDAAVVGGGDGHLAVRQDEAAEWKVLHSTDAIPTPAELRTSAAGVIRVDFADAALFLGRDARVQLDANLRSITITRGMVRLIVDSQSRSNWRIATGAGSVTCQPGSEVVAALSDRPQIDVLAGAVRLMMGQKEVGSFMGPKADVTSTTQAVIQDVAEWLEDLRDLTSPGESQGLGQLIANDPQSGGRVHLDIVRFHANVVLHAPAALVQIDQSFFNPQPWQEEGTFIFSLPPGASVSRFAMYVTHDQLIEGELVERGRADQIYTSIVSKKRDPAILEQIGHNLFKMRVFPIPARDTKRILLDFTVPLVATEGQYRFELPLMSSEKPIDQFLLTGTIHPPFTLPTISSPTHRELKFVQQANGTATFRSERTDVEPPPSLVLKYAAPADRKPSRRSYRLNEEEHYVVTIPGSMHPGKLEQTEPTDVLLLVDTSENTKDLKQAVVVAQTIAAGLRPNDRMRVGCIDTSYRSLTDTWYGPDSPQMQAGIQQLREQFSLGLAYLNSSVAEATKAFDDDLPLRRRLIVYVGSGELDVEAAAPFWTTPQFTSGQQRPAVIGIKTHGQSRDDWLSTAVGRTHGQGFDVSDAAAFEDLFAWTLTGMSLPPRIESLRLEEGDTEVLHDPVWPLGRDLLLYGCHKRLKGNDHKYPWAEGGEVTVGNQTLKFAITTGDSSEDDLFVGRMWAQQRLRKLFGQLTPIGDAAAKEKPEILTLCQRWSLMSPLTAFLVLESEQDYVRWKIDRQVRQRYWKPTGAIAPEGLAIVGGKTEIAKQRRSKYRQLDPDESKMIRQVMTSATAALQQGQPELAMVLLATVQSKVPAAEKEAYQSLFDRVQQKLRPETSLSSLNIWRPVADRRVRDWLPPVSSLTLQLAQRDLSPAFLQHQPHARELVKLVYDPPVELTIEEFVKYIQSLTNIPVLFDRQALQDEGEALESRLNLEGLNGISTRSLIREALEPFGLTMVPERHLWKLTTKSKADETLTTEVYPVQDLIQSQPLPSADRLANPYLDLDEAARRKIESNLNRPITVDFQDNPLDEVLENLALRTHINVRLDKQALMDEGVASDQQVTISLHNVPAGVALAKLLQPLGLTTLTENEILKVTTMAAAEEKRQTRVYCAIGVMEGAEYEPKIRLGGINPAMRPMGGMGTFGGMGMGGMGGGFFGGPPPPTAPAIVESVPETEPIAAVRPQAPVARAPQEMPEESHPEIVTSSGRQSSHLLPFMMETNSGKWIDIDQEGGTANYFPLSQSLLVWQTEDVHEQIADVLARLRHEFKGVPSWKPFRSTTPDFESLAGLIQGSTSGKWIAIDQEGGSMATNAAAKSLIIRQSAQVHEEILRILTQLRRARYIAESVPYRRTLEGIDETSLFDLPMLTQLPRQDALAKPNVNVLELKLLAAARLPQRLSQHWRSVSAATGQTRDATIRRDAVRLEVLLSDRTLRAEGTRAAIAYPGLALVEIDQWGEAVRRIADAALPWMPHRTNEDLAEVFDISRVEEDTRAITLRFGFPGLSDTYLEGTFSKLTRQPTRWAAIAGGQRQFDLEIDLRQVIALDSQGNELERWTLVADEAPAKIEALADGWGTMLVVDGNESNSMYQKVRQAIQRGDFGTASTLLGTRRTSSKVPGFKLFSEKGAPTPLLPSNKPLLHFLLAWSIENDTSDDSKAEVSQHLKNVATSLAVDLLRLITPTNFPSLGNQGISAILESIPVERRSAELCDQLTEYALGANNLDAALGHLTQALSMKSDPQSIQRRRLLQVQLLLQAGKADEAQQLVKALGLSELSLDQICSLADLFGRSGDLPFADGLYAQGRRRERALPTQLARLIYRQANWYPKGRQRWESLLSAANLLPASNSERWDYVQTILAEADQPTDAAILGELAATQQDREFQKELLLQQAELDEDLDLSAAIALRVADSHSLSEVDFGRVVTILAEAKRHDAIVRLGEERLRSRHALGKDSKDQLIRSYIALGNHSAARRAASEAPKLMPNPARPTSFF